jgi:REP element-mobilizing transposase RayT
MSVHKLTDQQGIYFITFTCYRWIPLIELTNGYDLVYNWFTVIENKGHCINAFVIMPNHLHCLLFFNEDEKSLNTLIGNGKRFMAYQIIERLKNTGSYALLKQLEDGVTHKDKIRGKKHSVWERAFDVKQCRTEEFVMQKLNYIHNNPCSGKWKLADSILHYPHSSAGFYISGKNGNYQVKDYRQFLNSDY